MPLPPATTTTTTTAIIVNFRTKELTLAAALSALAEPEVRQLIVVDNASGDGSAEFLDASLPASRVDLIRSPANLGFGRAVNLAANSAKCDLLLLLNSDATIIPGAVAALAVALLADRSVGMVAPAVFEPDGQTLQPRAHGRFPRVFSSPFRRQSDDGDARNVDWASGVALLLRRDDFQALHGFDESFEMYLEDVDLCRRLRRQGKTVLREPAAGVIHLGGQSWLTSVDKRIQYQRSKVIYFRKDGVGPVTLCLLRLLGFVRVGAVRAANRSGHRAATTGRAR